jgi:hypothetical protein
LDGRSWSLGEVPCAVPAALCEAEITGPMRRPDPPAVVLQHLQVERKFVIVNSKVKMHSLLHSFIQMGCESLVFLL